MTGLAGVRARAVARGVLQLVGFQPRGAVAWCGAYVAVTALLLAAVAVTGRFAILRVPHVLVVAALPLGLTIHLGGFV
ncbi:MAG: hypothetical protein ACTHMW_08015, partial [Actinomycetes bacterium]